MPTIFCNYIYIKFFNLLELKHQGQFVQTMTRVAVRTSTNKMFHEEFTVCCQTSHIQSYLITTVYSKLCFCLLSYRISPKTLLTYCTTGVLLRTLMSGDNSLSFVTHVLVVRDKITLNTI